MIKSLIQMNNPLKYKEEEWLNYLYNTKEKKYNVLLINSFNELVDVRDNLHSPIMFYNAIDHEMSKFYILNDNNLYLFIVKSKDIDGGDKKNEKKKNKK